MIIGACGFGSTGSSAISDYLLEYDNVQVLDSLEFTWVSSTDGLIDLERAVMHPHNRTSDSIIAINRFLKKVKKMKKYFAEVGIPEDVFVESARELIDSITMVKWDWEDFDRDYTNKLIKFIEKDIFWYNLIPYIEKRKGRQINCFPMKEVRLSVKPDNFYSKAKKHVNDLLLALGADFSKRIVLDQPFSGNNPQACFPFYDDPYAIVVDRDPRDNYVFAKTKLLGRNHFMAVEPVEDFIKYYRALRENQPYREPNERILSLHFEDMVYDYDNATQKIRAFLKLDENPAPKSVFDPALSIANTQVYKRFPQFAEDIKVIERELTDYLYDFEKYGHQEINGEMFFGKSPLHKK